MGVRLPAEYQEVEYLRSTGSQIIAVRNVEGTEFDVSITTDVYWGNVTKRQLHGADTRRYFGIVNGYYQVNQTGTNTTDLVAVINQWQHVVFSRAGSVCTLKVDSDERKVTSAAAASAPTGFCLFGIGQSNSYNCLCRLKRTLVEIEDDHYDFIPCYRKADSKPGMYDLVSGEFHTNQGTGEFLVGPDVIGSISPLMVARRMAMMQDKIYCPYITDGLIFWLDGIYKGNDPTRWKDLIGHKVFTLTGCTFQDRGVYFGGVGSGIYAGAVSEDYLTDTIEAAVTGLGNQQTILCSPYNSQTMTRPGISLITGQKTPATGFVIAGSNNSHKTIDGDARWKTLSVNEDRVVRNLSNGTFTGTNWWVPPSETSTTIGRRNEDNYMFKGTMHCLRIYNRKLTEEEMKFNQQVDNERFNLGL